MQFTLEHKSSDSEARAGVITTAHGEIRTPIFMPVGTQGTVKAVLANDLENEIKAQIILGNTYHLYLRPGVDIIQKAGGLHKFISWPRPILTDSGGFQVFSLSGIRKITDEGCHFRSNIDGSKHFFSPEKVMEVERQIGADIMMAFDECPPGDAPYDYARKSLTRTEKWLERCFAYFNAHGPLYDYSQALFPIVQGCVYEDLRTESALNAMNYDAEGYAIGGLAVGESAEDMYRVISLVCSILPANRPRYLMGVGTPENILEAISRGVDMFDCVMPSRNGRNAMLFTTQGIMNARNSKWKDDFSPIDINGYAGVDRQYTKAYLHHLFKAGEILALEISTIHNLAFYTGLMRTAREHILSNDFSDWKASILPQIMRRI